METFKRVVFLGFLVFLSDFGEGQEMIWKTAFSLKQEHQLAQNSLLTTLPKMSKEWKVSFEVNPGEYSANGYENVLHLTIGGKGLGSGAKIGDRTPAIWIHKSRGVAISSALNGKVAYTKTFKGLPPVGQWTSMEISQTLVKSKYKYRISINNKTLLNIENKKPVELKDVKVYAGSPWYKPRKGNIRNLEIEIKVPDCVVAGDSHFVSISYFEHFNFHFIHQKWILTIPSVASFADPWETIFALEEEHAIKKNTLLTTLPLLKEQWRVSFDFKASRFSGLGQIIHMTTGGKGTGSGSKYGDRTPAIWTHSSRGLLISSAVSGKYSYAKYFKPLPTVGEWTTIEVGQELVGTKMVYSIFIGGREVFSIQNSKASAFQNVKVLASSNWYTPVSGFIRNLLIQNKNDGESALCERSLINSLFSGFIDQEGCLLEWVPSYSLSREHLLRKNNLLTTLPTLGKEWVLSFEINPEGFTHRSYAQVVQLTIGGKANAVGDRTPAIWFHRTRGVYIVTTANGIANVKKFFSDKLPAPGEWTKFEIMQERVAHSHRFSVVIAGEKLWSIENREAQEFANVRVYAASPWYEAQAGSIRGLQIKQKKRGNTLFCPKYIFFSTSIPMVQMGDLRQKPNTPTTLLICK